MNSTTTTKHIIRVTVLAALIAGLTGCVVVNVKKCCSEQAKEESGGPAGPVIGTPPFGNAGSTTLPLASAQSGTFNAQCFPASAGWDRYIIINTNFPGPNTTPDGNSFTNIDNLNKVTVKTCDPANGTTLQTGIVIYDQFRPSTDKVCVGASGNCEHSPLLTVNQRSIVAGKKYRAVVHYKSTTAGGLNQIKVHFSYP